MSAFAIKLAENVLGVYVLSLLTLLLAGGFDLASVDALKAAAVAAIPAALSVLKGAIAKRIGSGDSPSFFE